MQDPLQIIIFYDVVQINRKNSLRNWKCYFESQTTKNFQSREKMFQLLYRFILNEYPFIKGLIQKNKKKI